MRTDRSAPAAAARTWARCVADRTVAASVVLHECGMIVNGSAARVRGGWTP
jgi:hypothetical protein